MREFFLEIKSILETSDIIFAIFISSVWWIANYLYKVSKGADFKPRRLMMNIVLAWFIWYVLQWFIEPWPAMWPLLAIWGFCVYPILQLIESKWPEFVSHIWDFIHKKQ